MTLHADRIGRRALTVGAAAGSILVATLTFAATQADAAYTAQVKAGTLQIRGDGASDTLQLAPTATTLVVDVGEDNTADFTFDRSTFTAVSVQAGDGDDEVRVLNAVTPFDMTIDGGAGNDTLIGANGNETLLGGSGNDFVDGNIGADTARLGSGDDTFEWDPGDGSDNVDGQGGTDALGFNGSNIGEEIHVAGNTLTRNVAAITMSFAGLENVNVRPLGGIDNVTVDGTDGDDELDLSANTIDTDGLKVSIVDPETTDRLIADGGAGDDTATWTGTAGDDAISFGRNGDAIFVADPAGLANARAEHLLIKALGGNDLIAGQNGVTSVIPQVTLDGGAGDDDLRGGDGADTLLGGSGNDHVDGNIGADTAQMGSGDDTFQWDPGDGSDTVDGQGGTDALAFNGSNIGEEIHVTGHQLTRNVAAITMNYTVEGVNVRTLGGVDIVTTEDLAGLKTVGVDLGADATADTVIANGTDKRDVVTVTKTGGQALVKGLPAQIAIAGSDPGIDLLRVNTLAGDDSVTVAPDVADLIATAVDLGADG
jgi:Ca2+-binding RTX toxin-like protein